ncbi:hypothetical protein PAGU1678_00430 [Paraclostridium bifermentans subsp. muricolitidis]|uniref:hypothetical protein n=1 Tax=Paraclostridium bifermentans TaxID=1490 RepID=UPI001D2F490B|nr:hypothetical protein [Paraclostridium bifermentans]GIM30773.1 hypothetical protein PAGU1678_00430 [Paraclostridium bifermentans subsp. muricolitidis]
MGIIANLDIVITKRKNTLKDLYPSPSILASLSSTFLNGNIKIYFVLISQTLFSNYN